MRAYVVSRLAQRPGQPARQGVRAILVLLDGRLRLRAEGAASLFSRDTRAGELENVGQPEWTGELFTPRVSSRLDYAWSAEARVALRAFSVGAQLVSCEATSRAPCSPCRNCDRVQVFMCSENSCFCSSVSAS